MEAVKGVVKGLEKLEYTRVSIGSCIDEAGELLLSVLAIKFENNHVEQSLLKASKESFSGVSR